MNNDTTRAESKGDVGEDGSTPSDSAILNGMGPAIEPPSTPSLPEEDEELKEKAGVAVDSIFESDYPIEHWSPLDHIDELPVPNERTHIENYIAAVLVEMTHQTDLVAQYWSPQQNADVIIQYRDSADFADVTPGTRFVKHFARTDGDNWHKDILSRQELKVELRTRLRADMPMDQQKGNYEIEDWFTVAHGEELARTF